MVPTPRQDPENVPAPHLRRQVGYTRYTASQVAGVFASVVVRQRPVTREEVSSYLYTLQCRHTFNMCGLGKHIQWLRREQTVSRIKMAQCIQVARESRGFA